VTTPSPNNPPLTSGVACGIILEDWQVNESTPQARQLAQRMTQMATAGDSEAFFREIAVGRGNQAVCWAARRGHAAVLRALLAAGASPLQRNTCEIAPLITAIRAGQVEAVRILINAGADPGKEWAYITPVKAALQTGSQAVLDELLRHGVDGDLALREAIRDENGRGVTLLLKAGVSPNGPPSAPPPSASSKRRQKSPPAPPAPPLIVAVRAGVEGIVGMLLDAGAQPHATYNGKSALQWALDMNFNRIIEQLRAAGAQESSAAPPAPPPTESAPVDPETALRAALANGDAGASAAAELLTRIPLPPPPRGEPPALFAAAAAGHAQLLPVLLAAGADPNSKHTGGVTAIMEAAYKGHAQAVKVLIDAGAKLNVSDQEGLRVLDYVAGNAPIEAMLIAAGAQPRRAPSKRRHRAGVFEGEDAPPPDFTESSQRPEFLAAIEEIAAACGKQSHHKQMMAGMAFLIDVPDALAERIIAQRHVELLARGIYLFQTLTQGIWRTAIGLAPTPDWRQVVAAIGTSGPNDEIGSADVIAELESIARKQPFDLTTIAYDRLGGAFTTPIAAPLALAKRLYKLCPDIVDQGAETLEKLAESLEKSRSLWLWWD
jgi:ankyrin repeat protein